LRRRLQETERYLKRTLDPDTWLSPMASAAETVRLAIAMRRRAAG
jgi:hypothetical protein